MPEYRGEMFRDDVARLVRAALQSVADVSDSEPIEQYVFTKFHPYHKLVFLLTLHKVVGAWKIDEQRHYNIGLNENDIDAWPTVKDCIDWVFGRKVIARSNTKTLQRPDLLSEMGD